MFEAVAGATATLAAYRRTKWGAYKDITATRLFERNWPADMAFRYKVRSFWLELCLRFRLLWLGITRGLQGTGVIAVCRLYATYYPGNGDAPVHLGMLGNKAITDAGVAALVDQWDGGSAILANFNYHGSGTTNTAENANQTALAAECTTALNPNNTRPTGTKSQPAANQARSVATATYDSDAAVVEHGIFDQAATGGGTMWDRTIFAAINVVGADADQIQFTHTTTWSSGG